ncbi:MAG: C10 family peptidase [Bacteroidota bacterium]
MNRNILHRILSLVLLTILISPASAKIVDQLTAEKAAKNFLYERLNQTNTVSYKDIVVSTVYTEVSNDVPVYYAINFRDGGFVVITAEDNVKPVIGFSPDGFFKTENLNDNIKDWMAGVTDQVKACREQNLKANATIEAEWARLNDNNFASQTITKGVKNVAPLIMSKWDQAKFFNSMCPADPAGEQGRALTGCVATAMAQVLFYYRYPTQGVGTHTYSTNSNNPPYGHYGTLSVNYTNSTYNYDGMVNSPTESNLDIAKLMYHAGVSVSMMYGATASGAQTQDVVGALTSHWKYSGTTTYALRSNYPDATWKSLIETEMDAKRPIMYSGRNPTYGHCFVLDGYQTGGTTTLYHFNWGWSGNNDGYYDIDALNPGNDPNGPFALSQGMVKGIYPSSGYPYQCTGQHLVTASQGTIEDGSSPTANYLDNANCSWLIAPTDSVNKITLSFNRFSTQSANDLVKVYDGADTTAPLLLTHSGDGLPAINSYTSSSNKMLVTFKSDGSTNTEGFLATFKPTYPSYCTALSLTDPSGTVSDGSSSRSYNNNTSCTWLIQPNNPDNKTLILTFTSFETEAGKDIVRVYDAGSTALLGEFSGTSLPPTLVSLSGQMYIEFQSNYINTYGGWSADYSLGFIGINENNGFDGLKIYPNPAKDQLNLSFDLASSSILTVDLISMSGQTVITETYNNFSGSFNKSFDLSNMAKGVYTLRLSSDKGVSNHKVVVQ